MLILIIAMIGLIFICVGILNASIKRMKKRIEDMHDDMFEANGKINLQLDLITEKVSDINVRVMVAETRLEERSPTLSGNFIVPDRPKFREVQLSPNIEYKKRKYVRKKGN